ncbi:MAG: beta-galactosidase, partial [Verrucomicrobiota bacterium]
PSWLRDVPGIRMRTFNEPFMQEVRRWLEHLAGYLRPLLAPNGGPVIMAQVENEYDNIADAYGEDGEKYLSWCGELARSFELGVPLIMCSGAPDNLLEGSSEGAIATINSHYAHELVDRHKEMHPSQPTLWTEAWVGWYDIYGYPHHVKSPENIAYAAARFFAAGGTGINYYVWHGGTNFARESMYLQTTSYDWGAPLDEFGNETTKYRHLKKLNRILDGNKALLLSDTAPQVQRHGEKQCAYVYESKRGFMAFLCNDDSKESFRLNFNGASHDVKPRSVIIVNEVGVLMDTAAIDPGDMAHRAFCNASGQVCSGVARASIPMEHASFKIGKLRNGVLPQTGSTHHTGEGYTRKLHRHVREIAPVSGIRQIRSLPSLELSGDCILSEKPLEQLSLTKNETDYCWYSTQIEVGSDDAASRLELNGVADVAHVFVDDKLCATTPLPLLELRGKTDGAGFRQSFNLELEQGSHTLSILCCSLGMIKGDWMLGGENMAEEKKGLWGEVLFNGNPVPGPWTIRPGLNGLDGDKPEIADAGWRETGDAFNTPLTWYQLKFNMREDCRSAVADMAGMNKGLIWLNGKLLGRYWLVEGDGMYDAIDGTFPELPIGYERFGEPTQRYYHLPSEWLEEKNTLVLFEELGGQPESIRICEFAKLEPQMNHE